MLGDLSDDSDEVMYYSQHLRARIYDVLNYLIVIITT